MPQFVKLEPQLFIAQILESSRYKVDDKNTTSYAVPIESGFYLFLYSCIYLHRSCWLSIGMILRWAILYELFLIIEKRAYSSELTKLHIQNIMPFLSEWLDDLMLFNWEFNLTYPNQTLVDWRGEELKDYHYILNRCKRCFAKFENDIPITSLHYNRPRSKQDRLRKYPDPDCSGKYKDQVHLKEYLKKISQINKDLYSIACSIRTGRVERNLLYSKLKELLKLARFEIISFANDCYSIFSKEKFYKDPDFNPILEIADYKKLYCPASKHRQYSSLDKLMKIYPSKSEILFK